MALSTYTELKDAIASWLARTDLTDQIPDFIKMAEARINRELRCREMITTVESTVSTQELTVPTDLVEVYRFTLDTESDRPLEYRPYEDSQLRNAGETSGEPKWFSIVGPNFAFYPAPDGEYSYTLDYYAKVPALSSGSSSSWLLTKAPELYVYGALVHAAPFLVEDSRVSTWNSLFDAAKRSLHAAEARAKRTSGPRRARVLA